MAPHIDARVVLQLLKMGIGPLLPAGPQFLQICCALGAAQSLARARTIALARSALLRGFCVVAPEILLRVALDAVHLSLGEHEVNVRLCLPEKQRVMLSPCRQICDQILPAPLS